MTEKIEDMSKGAQTIIGLHLIMSEFREWANGHGLRRKPNANNNGVMADGSFGGMCDFSIASVPWVMARPPFI